LRPDLSAATDLPRLRRDLDQWYDRHRRDLPWRRTTDPYAVWVSEVMLQQTQVATVIPYFMRWLERFADIVRLAAADGQTVLKLWEGLGYYARARNFHRAAQIVVQEHGGQVPGDPAAFRALPGVGDYIAAAVLSIAFDRPLAVVDGNVKRVLTRFLKMETPVNAPSAHKALAPIATRWLDPRNPGRFNQAVMELGALVCTPRGPRCDRCPLAYDCRSLADGCQSQYPRRLARRSAPTYRLVAAVVFRQDRLLIVQRPAEGLLGGLWEFPAMPLTPAHAPESTATAGISEILGIRIRVAEHLGQIRHAYTHFKIEAEIFRCAWQAGRVRRRGPAAHRWVTPGQLADYPLTGAAHKVRAIVTAFSLRGGFAQHREEH
jgi:A/G-specific adenine glycosylase